MGSRTTFTSTHLSHSSRPVIFLLSCADFKCVNAMTLWKYDISTVHTFSHIPPLTSTHLHSPPVISSHLQSHPLTSTHFYFSQSPPLIFSSHLRSFSPVTSAHYSSHLRSFSPVTSAHFLQSPPLIFSSHIHSRPLIFSSHLQSLPLIFQNQPARGSHLPLLTSRAISAQHTQRPLYSIYRRLAATMMRYRIRMCRGSDTHHQPVDTGAHVYGSSGAGGCGSRGRKPKTRTLRS